jgi:hypothetical protein
VALTVSGTAAQSFQYSLELEGVFVGRILSFAGGDAAADVVVEKAGADGVARKYLGAVRYEDISITCDANMAAGFYDWLQQAFGRDVSRKNGAIVTYGANLNEVARLSFLNALVTEVGFPRLDGSAQDAAKLIVKITPEHTSNDSGNSKFVPTSANRQRRWRLDNFRLTIDGTKYPHVSTVEAMTVSRPVAPATGQRSEPGSVVVPDLRITVPESSTDAAALGKWFDDFVLARKKGPEQEKSGTLASDHNAKSGTLEYLASDHNTPLFTLGLQQLGVYRLISLNGGTPSENIPRVQARMYCEQILFSYAGNAPDSWSSQPSGSLPTNPPRRQSLVSPVLVQNLALAAANQGVGSSAAQPRNLTRGASLLFRNLAQ